MCHQMDSCHGVEISSGILLWLGMIFLFYLLAGHPFAI